MEYKYYCSTLDYLKMESGLIPVPEDSVETFIVTLPEKGDLGRVEDKIYKFTGKYWRYSKDFTEEDLDDTEI